MKKAGIAIFLSDNIDFKTNTVQKTRKLHNDKEISPKEDMTL